MDASDLTGAVQAVVALASESGGASVAARGLGRWLSGRAGAAAPLAWTLLDAGLRASAGGQGARGALPLTEVAALLLALPLPSAPVSSRGLPTSADAPGLARALADGDVDGARDQVLGAAAAGTPSFVLEGWLAQGVYAHVVRSGHLAPALAACAGLREACGEEVACGLMSCLAAEIAAQVGRPLSPALQAHADRMDALAPRLPDLAGAADPARAAAFNEPRFRKHLLYDAPTAAASAVYKALAFGVPAQLVAASLSLAAAERLLHFDAAIAARPNRPENWEDLAWIEVLCSATRLLGTRHPSPGWWALLMHTAYIVNAAAPLEVPEKGRVPLPEPAVLAQTWDHGPEIARVGARLGAGDEAGAQSALRGYLLMVLPEQPLCAHLLQVAFEDRGADPVRRAAVAMGFSSAVEDFSALTDSPHRELLLCAAIRLACAPPTGRRAHELGLSWLDALETGHVHTPLAPLPWLLD